MKRFYLTHLQQAVEQIESLATLVAAVREAQTFEELAPLAKPVCSQSGLSEEDADEFLAHYRENYDGLQNLLHRELADTIAAWAGNIADNANRLRVAADEQGLLLACVDRLAECYKVCATGCYCYKDCACKAIGAAQSAIATAIVRDAVEACLPPGWGYDIDAEWSQKLEMHSSSTIVVQSGHPDSALTIGLGDWDADVALIPPFTSCAVMRFVNEAQDAVNCLSTVEAG